MRIVKSIFEIGSSVSFEGDVLQDYDADKRFPAFAFGAKPTKDEMVNKYFIRMPSISTLSNL